MSVAAAVAVVPVVIFFLCMAVVTFPLILAESGPRIVVGATVDTGSQLVALLGPLFAWAMVVIGLLGLAAIAVGRTSAWKSFWQAQRV